MVAKTLGTLTITIGITWINDFGIKIEGKFKNRRIPCASSRLLLFLEIYSVLHHTQN